MTAPEPIRVDPDIEEVRVALALNGGVSLAVWMGGCAVELDRARRTRYRGGGTTLYQALAQAFRRELVVDVMSGTSAGGINGALLAAALAKGVALEAQFLRDRWLDLGDFSKLLQPLSARAPASLMQGEFFADQLEEAFDDLCAGDRVVKPLVPALDITTTDIAGRPLQFVDTWHQALRAREYRARFRFRTAGDFEPDALAHAARASASFPLAFEPYAVPPDASVLAGLAGGAFVMDGGLLDNAPIRAALGLIPSRSAHRQVRRLLCYVNGDPAVEEEQKKRAKGDPTVGKVIGAMVDLPRKAPFADQLADLQAVTRNSGMALGAEHELLKTDLDQLTGVAKVLLPTYRRRRRLRTLQYGLTEPAEVQAAYEALDEDPDRPDEYVDLPWLRQTLPLAPNLTEWRWGIDAARRVHLLALEILHDALLGAPKALRQDVLKRRVGIDRRIEALNRARTSSFDVTKKAFKALARGTQVSAALEELDEQVGRDAGWIADDIAATAESLLHVMQQATEQGTQALAHGLFGDDWETGDLTATKRDVFMQRFVAVEVVRRSFTDDDVAHNTQQIAFAQLTPEAPAPLFSAKPFTNPAKASVNVKLCGAILGHFGAFYRRAWRANDFMWGRMDAAARITDMLVGVTRTKHLHEADNYEPWDELAKALVAGGEEQRLLLEEALADLGRQGTSDDLEERLRDVLKNDLAQGDDKGKHTRTICTRAAQFEILVDELQHVVKEATDDVKLGCTPDALGLGGLDLTHSADVYEALKRLRNLDRTLPDALGRNSAEISTDLAVRTIAHAGLISLAVSRSAGGPAFTPLGLLRSVLLPVSGATAQHWASRAGVVVAFGGASLYLSARLAATNADPTVNVAHMSFFGFLLAVVSLSVVLGTATVPVIRAVLGRQPRVDKPVHPRPPRVWKHWLWLIPAALLLAFGGIGAAVIALGPGPLNWAHLVVAPGVAPPWYVTLPALALGAGAALTGPRPLRKRIQDLTVPPWRGNWSVMLVLASVVLVTVWAAAPLWDAATSGEGWRIAAAWLPIAGIAVAAVTVVILPPKVAARRSPRPLVVVAAPVTPVEAPSAEA